MKRILVTGAGGSPAVNFTRSLRSSGSKYFLIGTDSDKYYLQRAEVDSRYLVPRASEEHYIDVLNHIIEKEGVDFIHAQNDVEVGVLSANRTKLKCKTMLPKHETILTLQDKFKSFEIWEQAGIKVPKTLLINRHTDLADTLALFGGSMWIRAITGAGGRGSLPVHDVKTAKNWLDFHEQNGSWDGNFTAAELLEPETVTWMSLWRNGELVVAQGRKRLYWELSKISPSGVTGATGTGVTYSDKLLDEIAKKAILSVDAEPNGLFGVDFAYDKNGIPNPTEINIGRFFTTHEFFTAAGLNLPEIFVQAALGTQLEQQKGLLNPLRDGLLWIRGIDFEPILSDVEAVSHSEVALARMLSELRP